MSLSQRKILPHSIPFWARDDSVFFITVCCHEKGTNQLCHPGIAKVVFESVSYRNCHAIWHARLCVLMPDHLHLLVSFPIETELSHLISVWKEHLAKRCGIKWQRNFFDHRLRNDESFRNKAAYIRENPVRKGLCTIAEEWSYTWTDAEADGPAVRPCPAGSTAR